MSPTSDRIVICDTAECQVELEYNEQYLVLHLPRVDKFNKTVLARIKTAVDQALRFAKVTGYGCVYAGFPKSDKKLPRLLPKLGLEYYGEDLNSYVYRRV